MILANILTQDYQEKCRPFYDSLSALNMPWYAIGINFWPQYQSTYYSRFRNIPNHWANDNGIFQYGRFVDYLNLPDDELVIYSDGDIIIQRNFTKSERQLLGDIKHGEWAAAWNSGENDNLQNEAARIKLEDDKTFYKESWSSIPCMNTGVVAMTMKSWRKLANLFESQWNNFKTLTQNRSRSQWLINWCLWKLGYTCKVLGPETHTHGHFGVPSGVRMFQNKAVLPNGQVIMFRHAF